MSEPSRTVLRQLNLTIASPPPPDAREREGTGGLSAPGFPATLAACQQATHFGSHPERRRRGSPAEAGPVYQLLCPPFVGTWRSMISHQRSVPGFPVPDQSSFTTPRKIRTLIPGTQGNNTRPYLYPTRRRLARLGLSDQWAVFNLYEVCTCTIVWGNSERRVPEAANRQCPPHIVALISSQSPRSR
jgi:hypothetical protein